MYDPGTLYRDPILTNFSVGYTDQALYGERLCLSLPSILRAVAIVSLIEVNWLIFESAREPGAVANEIQGAKWSEDSSSLANVRYRCRSSMKKGSSLLLRVDSQIAAFGGALQISPELDATALAVRSYSVGS